ncbi:MAG TPA: nucleoside hydrolase, partial [Candidatus Limnocylindrales bacterium]
DALAIALALARPELEVLGITTIGGNAPLAATTRNALRVLALLGRGDIPVAAGPPQPLVRALETAPQVHGVSGLDGADLPEPVAAPRPEGALEFLRATLAAAPAPVTLIPTGPLTNIALLLRTYPSVADKIARISLMGGAMRAGNWTPAAEFNIWVDPEAAQIVFRSGLPITMSGLEVTHKALFGWPEIARLDALGTRVGSVFADLLRFFVKFHVERYGTADTPWTWGAVSSARTSGCAGPAATGMSPRPRSASTRRALRVVAASGALPPIVVIPRTSSSGRARASAMASASSWPGSQSMMTGVREAAPPAGAAGSGLTAASRMRPGAAARSGRDR